MDNSLLQGTRGTPVERQFETSHLRISAFICLYYILNVPMIIIGVLIFGYRKLRFVKD